ncbi:MAG: PLP-dependent aminotransferase family protein, partial [Comamonas sp.]|nr:PLP-dependent aminotransferase family protein [Comamonas sp.]
QGCEVFARSEQSLYLWAAFPGCEDSAQLASALLARQVTMAPGRVFSLDSSATSRWSRCNVGAMQSPRLDAAMAPWRAAPG